VGKGTNVQRVALLAADVVPDLREQLASGFTPTSMVMQLPTSVGHEHVHSNGSAAHTPLPPNP